MLVASITVLVVPVLYCAREEWKLRARDSMRAREG